MLINCPLKSAADVFPLIREGADCFYFGVDGRLLFGRSVVGPLNRRPWKFANFDSLQDVRRAIGAVKKERKKINFVLNEHFYSPEQVSKAIVFIKKTNGIDGVIISDLGLALRLKKVLPRLNLIASTGMHIQNRSAVDFFYRIGIKKMILPRHFTPAEIENLTKKYGKVDFEVFIMNEDCANIDGLCNYTHGINDYAQGKMPCLLLSNFRVFSEAGEAVKNQEILKNLPRYKKTFFRYCGACQILFFQKIGIKSVKIVGRTLPVQKIKKDVRFIKYATTYADIGSDDFREMLYQKHKEIYNFNCGRSCLYDYC